ncbi:hypothetical protein V2J09_001644 [Rumex salicifolius]
MYSSSSSFSSSDYGFLKSFGCLCFPFIRPYNRSKLEYKSLPCIFLGYSPKHKGYTCYHVATARLYIVCHVIFDETTFPYTSHAQVANNSGACSSPSPTSISLNLLQQASRVVLPPTSPESTAQPLNPSPQTPNTQPPHMVSPVQPIPPTSVASPTSSPSPPPQPPMEPYPGAPSYYRPAASSDHHMVHLAFIQLMARRIPLRDELDLSPKSASLAKRLKRWTSSALIQRSKHIRMDYHFVREQVQAGQLIVRHVRAADQVADIFTKAVGTAHFQSLRRRLLVRPPP